MHKKIIDIIYTAWSSGEFGYIEPVEVEKTLHSLEEHFHTSPETYLLIETAILNLCGLYEKEAFTHGFTIGYNIASGKLI